MEYFTFEWWCGVQSGDEVSDPSESYRRHLDSIRNELTADLMRIEDDASLHDGQLRELRLDASGRELGMVVNGDDGRGGARTFHLRYCGVSVFESLGCVEHALPGPGGYGDLGYWEVDALGGAFEHRFLFSTGIELRIRFTDFHLEYSDNTESQESP